MNFPTALTEAAAYLSGLVTIAGDHEDGRVNSIADEETIISLLEARYGSAVERPKAREFFDVRLFGHPVQIKSSDFAGGGADNFSSKAAILYALSDMTEEEIIKVRGWAAFETALRDRTTQDNGRDYFILSLDKGTAAVHLASLKTLSVLTPNGNNLPFQVKWKANTTPVARSHSEAREFIVGAYKASVAKKVSVHALCESL